MPLFSSKTIPNVNLQNIIVMLTNKLSQQNAMLTTKLSQQNAMLTTKLSQQNAMLTNKLSQQTKLILDLKTQINNLSLGNTEYVPVSFLNVIGDPQYQYNVEKGWMILTPDITYSFNFSNIFSELEKQCGVELTAFIMNYSTSDYSFPSCTEHTDNNNTYIQNNGADIIFTFKADIQSEFYPVKIQFDCYPSDGAPVITKKFMSTLEYECDTL